MATFTKGAVPDLTDERVGEIAFRAYMEAPPEYTNIWPLYRSYKKSEKVSTFGAVGAFPSRTDGGPVTYYSPHGGYDQSVTHEQFAYGFRCTRETEEDDLSGIVPRIPELFGVAAKERIEQEAAEPFNGAFDSWTIGDSQYLVSTSHTSVDGGGTRSNRLATDSDLSYSTLWTAIKQHEALTDHAGNLLQLRPDLLVIPPELEDVADEILGSTLKPDTANNNANALRRRKMDVFVWQRLTDSDAWFIVDRRAARNSLRWYWRRPLDFDAGAAFDTQDAKYQFTFRCTKVVIDFPWIVGTPGA